MRKNILKGNSPLCLFFCNALHYKVLFFVAFININILVKAQSVGISNTTITPDTSALLEIRSTSKGLLIPRLTTAQRDLISTPATGLIIFNSTTNVFNFYNGSSWIEIGSATIPNLQAVTSTGSTSTDRITVGGVNTNNYFEITNISSPTTPPSNTGRVYTVNDAGYTNLEILTPSGQAFRFMRDNVFILKVKENSGISKGQVVYISGSTANNDDCKLYIANGTINTEPIGIAIDDGALNSSIRVMALGKISGINTNSFAEGAVLYASATTAGALTDVEPALPNLSVKVGIVSVTHPSNGAILITPVVTKGNQSGTRINSFSVGDNTAGIKSLMLKNGYDGLLSANPTANRTWTLPDATGTLSTLNGTETFTNKTISGSNNTITNISMSSLTGTLGVSNGGTGATTLTGILKGNGTSAFTAATQGTDYSAGTSALSTGILKSTTGTGALSIATAGDFPTLNQNTTGSAATLTTARNIYGNSFNGSADLNQIIASTYGGTGNGFTKFSGATTTEKTYTLPDASATILTSNAAVTATQGGTGNTSYTIGDLLYASGTSTLSKLAGVATGNALISGGVGTAPSWGKIDLTSHITGTLPVANGGTGASTLTGILKGNGTSAFTAAVSGTDFLAPNAAITGATNTKITYDSKGLVTAGTQAAASDLSNGTTGSGNIVLANTPTLTTPNLGVATSTSETISGTAGNGFLELQTQSAAPASGATNSLRLYSSSGNLVWKKQNDGFNRTISSVLTADRTYTLPDASGTIPVSASGNIALSASGNISFTGTLPVANGGSGATTLTGILKGNGTSAFTAAVSGTDFLAPNAAITGATNTKITYDSKGLVTAGTQAAASDLSNGTTGTGSIVLASSPTFTGTVTLPANQVVNGVTLSTTQGTSNFLRGDGTYAAPAGSGSGTVTSVSVTSANGISGSVATPTTTPAITLTLGAITPSSGTISGTAGAGFLELQTQSSAPASGAANSFRLYSSSGNLVWKKQNDGFNRTISSVLTADRTYTLPDASGTIPVSASGNIALSAAGNISFTGTLPVTNGGTGNTSYTIGDLLYASGSSTLSKLSGVATGNALISGGVGTAPSWGKINLTSHITGTLPVANGGTGTATAFTPGSLIFAGTGGNYNQNNSALFWNNSLSNLGIGTNLPDSSAILDLTSSTTGFLPPRLTTAQRDAIVAPATGLIIYNTDPDELQTFTGLGWASITQVGQSVGTVTNFSASNLSPLFTSSIANASSSPSLTFTLNNANANTYFGNSSASSAAPSFNTAGALTKTDDANVTLTLGGNPTKSLLSPTSLTLGWTGQLSIARGGTGSSTQNFVDLTTDQSIAGAKTFSGSVLGPTPTLSAHLTTKGYVDGNFIPTSEKAAANGVASLDGSGKIPTSQLPSGSTFYKGTWNASTNTPTLSNATGQNGWEYFVSVAGTQNLGSGNITFVVGDQIIHNGSVYQVIPNSNTVTSVNGSQGAVVLTTTNISEGTNLYSTNARTIAATLTGFTTGTNTAITSSNSVLTAFQNTQAQLNAKANIASPTFTGTPIGPTAAPGTNTTQLATTEFVTTANNLKADLLSPDFTGTPTAPTAAAGTNTTQIATTEFVLANNPSRVIISSNVVNSTTSFADVTGLSFPVVSGGTYYFRFLIPYSSAATSTGSSFSINGPTTTQLNYTVKRTLTATTGTISSASSYNSGAANATSILTGNIAEIVGIAKFSASGNVIARFFSEVSGSAITVLGGAMVEYMRTQ